VAAICSATSRRILRIEWTCHGRRRTPSLRRVSDTGHDRRSPVHDGRRPKAASGGASASLMGDLADAEVCAKERDAPGQQRRDRQVTAAGIDGWDDRIMRPPAAWTGGRRPVGTGDIGIGGSPCSFGTASSSRTRAKTKDTLIGACRSSRQ
jgi:hypothetical protein